MWTFEFLTLVNKKVTSAGLNSLRQKMLKSVRNWIFDDPFNKKGLVLVILVLGMIKSSGSVIFFNDMRLLRSLRPLRMLRPLRSLRLKKF